MLWAIGLTSFVSLVMVFNIVVIRNGQLSPVGSMVFLISLFGFIYSIATALGT